MRARTHPITCLDCGIELTDENWYQSKQKNHEYRCKSCGSKRSLAWTRKHGRNPIPNKEHTWRRQGIKLTYPEYLKMLEKQQYRCLICGRKLEIFGTTSADHNHKTGVVRGLLCKNCNANLGWYEKYQLVIQQYLLTSVPNPLVVTLR